MIKSKYLLGLFLVIFVSSENLVSKVLTNKEWFKNENLTKPIVMQIDGKALDIDKNTKELISYYYEKPFDYFFLPKNKKITEGQKKCAQNIKENLYSISPNIKEVIKLPSDFTWKEDPYKDVNWQFFFHSWYFSDCLIDGYSISKDPWYLNRLRWVVSDWWRDNFKENYPSEFSWYDHTIPKRLHKMLLIFEILRRNHALDDTFTPIILRAIYWHAEILAEEEALYIKNHNHGLDQSNILFEASQILPEFQLAKKWKEISKIRLKHEIDYALTFEGVHKENSPGYHIWISPYSASINNFSKHYTGELLSKNSRELEEGGLKFIVAITKPNKKLSPLGDTGPNQIPYISKNKLNYPNFEKLSWYPYYQYLITDGRKGEKPEQTTILFPKSGYFIYRDKWDEPGENTAMHLVLKCGFLSKGHRQNDDGNVLLYSMGEDWLIDAGIYGFTAGLYRSYTARPSAHNLSFPFSARNSWPNGLNKTNSLEEGFEKYTNDWGIVESNTTHAMCRSHMYRGFTYQRKLTITDKHSFTLRDSIIPEKLDKPQYFTTLFKTPDDKDVYINKDKMTILIVNASRAYGLKIQYHKPFKKIELYRGEENELLSFETIGWNKMRPAKTVAFFDKNISYTADFDLRLVNSPDLKGFKKMHVQVKKEVEINYDDNIITFNVMTIQKNHVIAFYLFKDGIHVDTQWYSKKSFYQLDTKKYNGGKYHIGYFIVDEKEKNPAKSSSKEIGYSKIIQVE